MFSVNLGQGRCFLLGEEGRPHPRLALVGVETAFVPRGASLVTREVPSSVPQPERLGQKLEEKTVVLQVRLCHETAEG
jgi:hypothetical protein